MWLADSVHARPPSIRHATIMFSLIKTALNASLESGPDECVQELVTVYKHTREGFYEVTSLVHDAQARTTNHRASGNTPARAYIVYGSQGDLSSIRHNSRSEHNTQVQREHGRGSPGCTRRACEESRHSGCESNSTMMVQLLVEMRGEEAPRSPTARLYAVLYIAISHACPPNSCATWCQ